MNVDIFVIYCDEIFFNDSSFSCYVPFFLCPSTVSDSDEESSSDDEGEESNSESSEEDLVPYNLDDNLADSDKVKAPRYIRDCLDGLRSDEPELIGATLDAMEAVIKRSEGVNRFMCPFTFIVVVPLLPLPPPPSTSFSFLLFLFGY
jgi:hypothetical protein